MTLTKLSKELPTRGWGSLYKQRSRLNKTHYVSHLNIVELSRKRMQLRMTRYVNREDNDNRTAHKVMVHIGSNSPSHFVKLQIAVAKKLAEDYNDEHGKIHHYALP